MEISAAIPYHGNRSKWTRETIFHLHNIAQIKEIVLTFEPGSEFRRNATMHKVKEYQNDKRLYVMRNKYEAVKRCNSEWVMIIDSDNIFNRPYVMSFLRVQNKNKNTIYCPEIGFPQLRYSNFIGLTIDLDESVKMLNEPGFDMFLNTMNYIVHRETWLSALEEAIEADYEPLSADSVWMNYNCMKSGMVMQVVPGMIYKHTIHKESFYRQNASFGESECVKIYEMMRRDVYGDLEEKPTIKQKENWSGKGEGNTSTADLSAKS